LSQNSIFFDVIGFFVVWLLVWLPFAIPFALKLNWRPFQSSSVSQKLPLLSSLYLLAPLVLWGCWQEQTSFANYGMPFQWSLLGSLSWGLILGSAGLAGLFFVQTRVGWLQFTPRQLSSESLPEIQSAASKVSMIRQVLLLLALGLWVGWTEELIFRGFLQTRLQAELSWIMAASISSLIFALLHGIWEGKTVLPQLPGLWLMGMVLTQARWIDQGDLGLAWGLHAGWVWILASSESFWTTHYTGKVPAWVTGNGQPLAGVIGLAFLISTAVVLWLCR
jgi:membrane protease YdiL (CAAX protease family)